VICSERDIRANDYADLVACANDTPCDPLGIYSHGERSERRGVAGPSCPPPTGEGGSEVDMVGRNIAQGCKRPAPRPARRRVGTRLAAGGRNGDRRVDHVDVGAYLAHADSNGLVGPPAGMANYGRPLRLPFDADGDGRLDLFDWYALQTCYDRDTTRCQYLFDADASALVDGPDLDAFRASAEPPYSGPPSKPWRRQLIASRYGNPFMWTGQRYDATTGQYHFWARAYSPRLGRWLQRDPLGYLLDVSLYQHVSSRPVGRTDSLGLHEDPVPTPLTKVEILDPITEKITSETIDKAPDCRPGDRNYWRVDVEVQKESGNVNVHSGGKKYYYDPATDTFFEFKTGNEVSRSLDLNQANAEHAQGGTQAA